MIYDCFNNSFTADYGNPSLNIHPITINDRTIPHKRSHYTPAIILATIYVASEKYVSNLTTPYDSPKLLLLPYDDTNHSYATKND